MASTGTLLLAALGVQADDGRDSGLADAMRQVEARIVRMEARLGPFAADLAEPSAELGIMLLSGGEHAEARKAFRRAMQIERINTGLYTPRQLPFLDLAIKSSVAAGDWEQVDDDFRYFEWLNYRIHDDQDMALVDALDRIINWHLAAIHLDAESEKGLHLLRLLDLGERRLELSERLYGRSHPRYLQNLYELAMHLYYINVAAHRAGTVSATLVERLTSPIDHRRSFYLAQEKLSDDCYKKGRQLLEQALDGARGASGFTTQHEGIGLVYLADWELMFNHPGRAERLYQEAFVELLAAGVSPDELQAHFATPALLPEPRFRLAAGPEDLMPVRDDGMSTPEAIALVPWAREIPGVHFPSSANPGVGTAASERYALARFHVEENGWTENIRIIEVYPDDKALSRRARSAFWYAQFRPRLEEGRIAVARDVEARYLPPE